MDIFELAKAKKMFGGGGGKREGTAIPAGENVDLIYFNVNNTPAETDALLSQLTFVETSLLDYPIYPVYARMQDENTGSLILVIKKDNGYEISEVLDIGGNVSVVYYKTGIDGLDMDAFNGWQAYPKDYDYFVLHCVFPSSISTDTYGQCVTELLGLPIGAENEKIKNVLSITPF